MKKVLLFASVIFSVVAVAAFMSGVTPALATDTSATLPTSGTTVSNFGNPWTNPGNITADDTTYATGFYNASSDTDWLVGTGFGFSIPAGSTINGITVAIKRKNSAASPTCADTVQLRKAGSVTGSTKAGANWTTVDVVETLGNSADVWGASPSVSDVNSSTFGVGVECSSTTGAGATGSVDYIKMTVSYTAGAVSASITSDATIFE